MKEDNNYQRYLRLQQQRHQILLNGTEPNTPPVDDLEDEMGVLWDTLTPEQQKQANARSPANSRLK